MVFRNFVILALVIYGIARYYDATHGDRFYNYATERVQTQNQSSALKIGLVWPAIGSSSLAAGAQLAMSEINEQGGVSWVDQHGVGQTRQIALPMFPDKDEMAHYDSGRYAQNQPGLQISRQIAKRTDILAAVGHNTEADVPASVVYERSWVLFLAPSSTNAVLTRRDFNFVFRMAPNDRDVGEALVRAAQRLVDVKRIRVALLYPEVLGERSQGNVASRLTALARQTASKHTQKIDFQVVHEQVYQRGRRNHRRLVERLLDDLDRVNVILIADVLPDATVVRLQIEDELFARTGNHDIPVPVVNLDELDWSRRDGLYFDFNPAQSDSFFVAAAELVLRRTQLQVAILASRTAYGRRLRAALTTSIELLQDDPSQEFDLVVSNTYELPAPAVEIDDGQPPEHTALLARLRRHPPDLAFLIGKGADTVELIGHLRAAGFDRPIICTPAVESELLMRWVAPKRPEARARDNVYVVSTFDPFSNRPGVQSFVRAFQRHVGDTKVIPDANAAYGYYAIRMIKDAVERAGSLNPLAVANALRRFVDPDGVLGDCRFSENGELLGLQFVLKYIDDTGQLMMLPLPPSRLAHPDSVTPGHIWR